jgi:hypothetical protein
MTIVDFQLDEASLAEDLLHSPEKANPAALEETYFVMPVRLCVNGVEMFERHSRTKRNVFVSTADEGVLQVQLPREASCWLPLPLLGFATDALRVLNELKPYKDQKLNLAGGGHLVLSCESDQITVESSINGNHSSTHSAEALNAFRIFSDKVQQLLISRAPTIQQNTSWRRWFA